MAGVSNASYPDGLRALPGASPETSPEMSVAKLHVPSRAPPAGSVASMRSRRSASSHPPPTERRKSVASTRAPTVVPADSISQAGDRPEIVPSRSARVSEAGRSTAGSQRLTAEALEALTERGSKVGGDTAVVHHVEVIEEGPSGRPSSHSRAPSKSVKTTNGASQPATAEALRSSHVSNGTTNALTRVPSKAGTRASARPATAVESRSHISAATRRDAADRTSVPTASKPASVAPTHRPSRRTSADMIEVTEPARPNSERSRSVAPSHHSVRSVATSDKRASAAPIAPPSAAPSRVKSRALSQAASRRSSAAPRPSEVEQARSVASHAPSHHPGAGPARSVASHAPSHATSHPSAATSAKSASSHATSRHTSAEHRKVPSSPTSPTAPTPPAAFADDTPPTSPDSQVGGDMQLVQRSSYEVAAPRDTKVDIVEMRRRDGQLLEREYTIAP